MRESVEERQATSLSGWLALPLWLALAAWAAWPFIGLVAWNALGVALPFPGPPSLLNILAVPLLIFLGKGFGILQPNIAAIFTFFGRYAGTRRSDGFYWVNPFFQRQKMSLRANNLNTPTLKVNDRAGNPVEVAAVVVWRVADTARAAASSRRLNSSSPNATDVPPYSSLGSERLEGLRLKPASARRWLRVLGWARSLAVSSSKAARSAASSIASADSSANSVLPLASGSWATDRSGAGERSCQALATRSTAARRWRLASCMRTSSAASSQR